MQTTQFVKKWYRCSPKRNRDSRQTRSSQHLSHLFPPESKDFSFLAFQFCLLAAEAAPCPIKADPRRAQTRPPVVQMRRELSQCFLSDCRALRFHLWSKLRASVPGCHTNSPFHSPLSSPCPPPLSTCHDSLGAEAQRVPDPLLLKSTGTSRKENHLIGGKTVLNCPSSTT